MQANPESINEIDFTPVNTPFSSPRDWRDQFIYFLLVDRFDNAAANIPPYDPATAGYGRNPAQAGLFQGGKLKGITRRLDYIKNLGATAIWLSPIFKNRQEKNDAYHGYGIQNFLEVDPRFGTKDDLKELVNEAHAKGLYVIMDIVINHTGDNWAYPGDYPYYFWSGAPCPFDFGFWRKLGSSTGLQINDGVWPREFQNVEFYKRRGQITNWFDPDQAINGDFLTLKELDVRKSSVLSALIAAYKYWICEADIDGFRVDTVKHMEDSSTAIFCNAVREYAERIGKHNFFIFGEIVGDDTILQKYIGRNSRLENTNERFPSLNAALDFPLYFILEETIKGFKNSDELRDRYEKFKNLYADHGEAGRYFVTFVDNHDQMSRPYRRFLNNNPAAKQAVLAIGYLLTSQGIPCVYYGTEQGFDGGGSNDGYVRECMFGGNWGAFNSTGLHFFNESNPIYQGIKSIATIRSMEPALRYGRQYFREISGDGVNFGFPLDGKCTLAYSRVLDTDEILVALNLDANRRNDCVTLDKNLNPPGSKMIDLLNGGSLITVEEANGRAFVRLGLNGHTAAILKAKF